MNESVEQEIQRLNEIHLSLLINLKEAARTMEIEMLEEMWKLSE